jgi:hypothetical protein
LIDSNEICFQPTFSLYHSLTTIEIGLFRRRLDENHDKICLGRRWSRKSIKGVLKYNISKFFDQSYRLPSESFGFFDFGVFGDFLPNGVASTL